MHHDARPVGLCRPRRDGHHLVSRQAPGYQQQTARQPDHQSWRSRRLRVGYVGYFNAAGLESYDIVGWDPRGVGRSTPVNCFGRDDLDRYFSMDNSPDDPGELRARIDVQIEFGQSCLRRSGALLEHVSTIETVRDLDLLRYLVGDSKINYFGSSYGTRIGALYAELFHSEWDGWSSMARSTSIPSPRSIKWMALSGHSAISLVVRG